MSANLNDEITYGNNVTLFGVQPAGIYRVEITPYFTHGNTGHPFLFYLEG